MHANNPACARVVSHEREPSHSTASAHTLYMRSKKKAHSALVNYELLEMEFENFVGQPLMMLSIGSTQFVI